MRYLIYVHLVAVTACACTSLADARLLWSQQFSESVLPFGTAILLPALIAWLACPIGTLVIACRSYQVQPVSIFILTEIALFFAQFATIYPAVC